MIDPYLSPAYHKREKHKKTKEKDKKINKSLFFCLQYTTFGRASMWAAFADMSPNKRYLQKMPSHQLFYFDKTL
jgi:hypothetical protein